MSFIENHMETEEERSKIGAPKIKNPEGIPTQRSIKETEIRTTIQSEFEKELTLLGVTAMEDLLQDSVQ